MNNVLILLDNPDDWKPYCETKSILTVNRITRQVVS